MEVDNEAESKNQLKPSCFQSEVLGAWEHTITLLSSYRVFVSEVI